MRVMPSPEYRKIRISEHGCVSLITHTGSRRSYGVPSFGRTSTSTIKERMGSHAVRFEESMRMLCTCHTVSLFNQSLNLATEQSFNWLRRTSSNACTATSSLTPSSVRRLISRMIVRRRLKNIRSACCGRHFEPYNCSNRRTAGSCPRPQVHSRHRSGTVKMVRLMR